MMEESAKVSNAVVYGKRDGRKIAAVLIAVILLVSASVAVFMRHSNQETEEAVHNVSLFYLEELSANVAQVFTTHFDGYFKELWLAMLATYETDLHSEAALDAHLKSMASRGDFLFYALLDEDGNVYMSDEQYLDTDIAATLDTRDFSKQQIWVQETAGEKVVVIAHEAPAGTEILDGVRIVAGAKGIPVSKIEREILLHREDNSAFAQMILPDGTYLISDYIEGFTSSENFFDDLRDHATFNRYSMDTLVEGVRNKSGGNTAFYVGGERHYSCYIYLPRSGWTLVVTVPFHTVSAMMQETTKSITTGGLLLMMLILAVVSAVFGIYIQQKNANMKLDIQRMEAEERNRAKSSFLSSMSHDIRTPMNAIIGFTTLAMKQDVSPKVSDYLHKISTASNHLLSLINDVLDMSRIESGKMTIEETECNLPEVLRGLITIIDGQINAKEQHFYLDVVDVVDEDVWCDPIRLNQVLLNFLSNAVKFTPAGGTISVLLKQNESTRPGYGAYEFRVKDTGIGMSEEFAKKVFEPFERERSSTVSKIQGTGLGMSIAKTIIDMMGGSVRVETEMGKGTEFIVNLELRLQEAEANSSKREALKGLRALVMGDEAEACDGVIKMLHHLGMEAECKIDESRGLGETYDVVIVDWQRPVRNDFDVIRQIRACDANLPILLMFPHDWGTEEAEVKEAGATALYSRPLFVSDLQKMLLEVLSVRKGDAADAAEESLLDKFMGKRILLAEDNELNREIATEILQGYNFAVESAENGKEAYEKVKASAPGYYDVILMDVQMPVMNGYEASRAIRGLKDERLAGIPILAMTANAFDEDKQNARDAGMNGHIAKPIDMEVLLGALQEHL